MRDPRIRPTLVIVGVNRSGTTALSHAFLNHPEVELYKDPGKYRYESTGVPDFSAYFAEPRDVGVRVRVLKYSIGQYTPELCTIPIYPTGDRRPDFLRQLHHVFLIRDPEEIWASWQAMTQWIASTEEPTVRLQWKRLQADKGIPLGWGGQGLLGLATSYLRQTYEMVKQITPETTHVVSFGQLASEASGRDVLRTLTRHLGMDYTPSMSSWEIPFGQEHPRLHDGFNRSMDDVERRFIHRTIRASRGLGQVPGRTVASTSVPPHVMDDYQAS